MSITERKDTLVSLRDENSSKGARGGLDRKTQLRPIKYQRKGLRDDSPEVGCQDSVGLGNGNESGLDELPDSDPSVVQLIDGFRNPHVTHG